MLSELRETNQQLREKLEDLKKESSRLCGENERCTNATSVTDTSIAPSLRVSSSTRRQDVSVAGVAPIPCGGIVAPCRYSGSMLSDRAKQVRGEASKRIDGLIHDWRDYKEKADDEIRRRYRSEQNLREMMARKERETSEMVRELSSLRVVSQEQKKMIEELTNELEINEKSRSKCAELELQVTKLNRTIVDLNEELRTRDDIIRSNEAELESIDAINAELRARNVEQKRKIESCEEDVNETRMELEILEEMVRALNERKLNIFSHSTANSVRSVTPLTTVDYSISARSHQGPLVAASRTSAATMPYFHSIRDDIIPVSYNTTHGSISTHESSRPLEMPASIKQSKLLREDSDRLLADRRSAMSALKSLQKEHNDKCNSLAEHIRKLKEENKAKEKTILDLTSTTNTKFSPLR